MKKTLKYISALHRFVKKHKTDVHFHKTPDRATQITREQEKEIAGTCRCFSMKVVPVVKREIANSFKMRTENRRRYQIGLKMEILEEIE